MRYPMQTDPYHLTVSELLHEVCTELLDGRDIIEELRTQREELIAAGDKEQAQAYELAEEDVQRRLDQYHELGDLLDEVIARYRDIQEEQLADEYECHGEHDDGYDYNYVEEEEVANGVEEYVVEEMKDDEKDAAVFTKMKKQKKDKKGKKEKKDKKSKKKGRKK